MGQSAHTQAQKHPMHYGYCVHVELSLDDAHTASTRTLARPILGAQ